MKKGRINTQAKLALTIKFLVAVIIYFSSQFVIIAQTQDPKNQEIIKQMEEYKKLLNPSAKQKVI